MPYFVATLAYSAVWHIFAVSWHSSSERCKQQPNSALFSLFLIHSIVARSCILPSLVQLAHSAVQSEDHYMQRPRPSLQMTFDIEDGRHFPKSPPLCLPRHHGPENGAPDIVLVWCIQCFVNTLTLAAPDQNNVWCSLSWVVVNREYGGYLPVLRII